MNCGYCS